MFLDPEPKGREKTTRVSSPSSPFFASQTPIASPRLQGEQSWRIKRSPLQDSSPTFKNSFQRRSTSTAGEDGKSTVRLVGQSPASPIQSGSSSENDLSRKQDWPAGSHAQPHTSLLASYQPTSGSETGSPAASRVSDVQSKIAWAQQQELPHITTLLPSAYSKLQNRRSTSSKYSGTGTTNSTEAFDSLFTGSDSGRTGRLSGRSTLNEEEIPSEIGDEDEGSYIVHSKGSALETVRETSPEQSTAPSVSSSNQGQSSDTARDLHTSPLDYSPSSSHYQSEDYTNHSPQESVGSLPASTLSLPRSPIRQLTGQDSQDTLSYEQYDYPETSSSSPNFIAYNDSTSPSSPNSQLHNAGSLDSIQARLGTSPAFRPTTSGSAEGNITPTQLSPRNYHYRSLSADTVSPLQSPTRREQDQPRTRSNSMNASDNMEYEDIDLEPWPRNQFSSHLSTIASESDRAMSPAQFSHFSMGSGVLTIDDAYSIPMSATRSRGSGNLSNFSLSRRASEPLQFQSPSNKSSRETAQQSEEEVGDMTLGVYRAESAKPEPLFLGRQVTSTGDVRYDGPLPPLPPMPAPQSSRSDETSDRLSALSAPSLKKKRSGYSVRGRSNSTPSGNSRSNSIVSYADSDRWSRNSTVFPLWAKNFYGGYAALLSASKISLHNPPTPRRESPPQPLGHIRNMSQRTQHSITSRLGTGYSEIESVSPTSSHFLPAIFRPRTRTLGASDGENRSFGFGSKAPKRKNDQPQADEPGRSKSMTITSVPVDDQSGDTLPSGHPRFGTLKDNSSNQPTLPPLPRKYSKQKLWDEMTFPRPMTKDRLSDFNLNTDDTPHLRPNKRQTSINKWRSPSFVESYHTLLSSRGNRQILLFALGFLCPFFWLLGALLPLPPRHMRDANEAEKALPTGESEDDLTSALNKHRSGDAKIKWDEERIYLKAKWWRTLNRVMCFVGVAIIAAVVSKTSHSVSEFLLTDFQIALAVIATK